LLLPNNFDKFYLITKVVTNVATTLKGRVSL
jgi:hypothetical protein